MRAARLCANRVPNFETTRTLVGRMFASRPISRTASNQLEHPGLKAERCFRCVPLLGARKKTILVESNRVNMFARLREMGFSHGPGYRHCIRF